MSHGVCIPNEECFGHEDCAGNENGRTKCCNDFCCTEDYFDSLPKLPCEEDVYCEV